MPTLVSGAPPRSEGANAAEVNAIKEDIDDVQIQLERDYYLVNELDNDLGTQGGLNPRIGTKPINLARLSKVYGYPIWDNLLPAGTANDIGKVLTYLASGASWQSLTTYLLSLGLNISTVNANLVPSRTGFDTGALLEADANEPNGMKWVNPPQVQTQATASVTYAGVGSVQIPDISSATPGSVLEVVPYGGVNELVVSGPCYFAGRPSDNSNISMTASNGPTTFTQFTALTAFTGGNSSSGVSWSSGSVTLSTAGVYTVHYGLNVNSTNCKIKRCIAQLRNGTTVLANSKWSSEVNGATPLHFYPSHGSWMGTLAANSSLQLWYQIAVVDTTGATRILEYSTSTYGEYGGTYLYGFKIA